MPASINPNRPTRLSRALPLALATVASGILVTGYGGSAPSPTAATVSSASTSASTATARGGAVGPGSIAPGAGGSALAFASCMRASGEPNFPDPQPGGGFRVPSGDNPAAPAFQTAQARCWKHLPGGGPPGPGSTTHPSPQTLAKLLRISRCMRQHGVAEFPDPRTSVPSLAGSGIGVVTDFDGAILLFPRTLDLEAPAYTRALVACGAPPLGLPH